MITLSSNVTIQAWELQLTAIRAQGAGGQNVNKVSSAIHLRFDVTHSSLPDFYKQRILALRDSRLTADGVIIIKAQAYRTQEQNREDALKRLKEMIDGAMVIQKARRATKPSRNAKRKRVDQKTQRGATKQLRGKVR